jgi:hypothetical protein
MLTGIASTPFQIFGQPVNEKFSSVDWDGYNFCLRWIILHCSATFTIDAVRIEYQAERSSNCDKIASTSINGMYA